MLPPSSRMWPLPFALLQHSVQPHNCRLCCGCPKLWDKDIRKVVFNFSVMLSLLGWDAGGNPGAP